MPRIRVPDHLVPEVLAVLGKDKLSELVERNVARKSFGWQWELDSDGTKCYHATLDVLFPKSGEEYHLESEMCVSLQEAETQIYYELYNIFQEYKNDR